VSPAARKVRAACLMKRGEPRYVHCYDDGGQSFDRYTVVSRDDTVIRLAVKASTSQLRHIRFTRKGSVSVAGTKGSLTRRVMRTSERRLLSRRCPGTFNSSRGRPT